MTSTVPSWTAIDSVSGILSINAPEVSLDTEYDIYINSAVSGVSNPVQKLIKIINTNCTVKNWKKCISTSTLTCETCLSGYVLSSGMWDISKTTTSQSSQSSQSSQTTTSQSSQITTSETVKALSQTLTSAVMATTGIVVMTSMINTASIANLWMTINQLQLFIFVILNKIYFNSFFRILIKYIFNWLLTLSLIE